MKTAVSLPDAVFARAERLAKRLKKSRSRLYAEALVEYVARHDPDEVTRTWNEALEGSKPGSGEFTRAAARRVLARTQW